MEALRMKDVVPEHPTVTGLELGAQEGGREPEVLISVHVRIRDGRVPLGPRRIRPCDIHVGVIPGSLPSCLERPQIDLLRRRDAFSRGPRSPGRSAYPRPRFRRPPRGWGTMPL